MDKAIKNRLELITYLSFSYLSRVSIQTTKDSIQNENLPPEHRREGSSLLAHHSQRELETGDQDRSSDSIVDRSSQRPRARTPVEGRSCRRYNPNSPLYQLLIDSCFTNSRF